MPYDISASHESPDGWVSRDFRENEEGELEDEDIEGAYLYKIIIEYEDDNGNKHYISTNIFTELEDAEEAADLLASEYGIDMGVAGTIVRGYFH